MTREIRLLYAFHFFNSLALTVLVNPLFVDKLFLVLGLNLAQFGVVKGVSMWLPPMLNLLISPWLVRLNQEHIVCALAWLLRIFAPALMLVLPWWTRDQAWLTVGFTIILIVSSFFPIVGINTITALCKAHIPRTELGQRMGMITLLWNLPYYLAAIPCAWWLDRQVGTVEQFLQAMILLSVLTGVLQLPASVLIWRIGRCPSSQQARVANLRTIVEPFRDRAFRNLLRFVLVITALGATVQAFIVPFAVGGLRMSLTTISTLEAIICGAGVLLIPWWGRIVDRHGGRNVLRLCVLGVGLALLPLSTGQHWAVLLFAALAWRIGTGVFGFGLTLGQQVLTLALAKEERSYVYMSAASFLAGCGWLLGSLGGGILLEWLRSLTLPEHPTAHFQIYFTFCGLGFLMVGPLLTALRDGRRRMGPVLLMLEMYRTLRSWTTRSR